jgi:hypothetical protein
MERIKQVKLHRMSGIAERFPSLNGAATDRRPVLFIAYVFTDAKQGMGKNQCDSQPLPSANFSEHLQTYTEYLCTTDSFHPMYGSC